MEQQIQKLKGQLNEASGMKDVQRAEKSLNDKFKKTYDKIVSDLSKEASKMFKGKEVTGVSGYFDPEDTSRGDIKPTDTILVQDAKVEVGQAAFGHQIELIFIVKGKEYYMSTY